MAYECLYDNQVLSHLVIIVLMFVFTEMIDDIED